MQINLEIDSGNIGSTVVEVFNNLSHEKKEEIAEKILTKWLEDPYVAELELAKKEFCQKCRNERKQVGWDTNRRNAIDMTDMEIIKEWHYEFTQFNNSRKTSKQQMIEAVIASAVKVYKEKAESMVKDNAELQKTFSDVMERMKDDFPKFVHDAMMYWFTQQFTTAMQLSSKALMQSVESDIVVKQIRDKLQM